MAVTPHNNKALVSDKLNDNNKRERMLHISLMQRSI